MKSQSKTSEKKVKLPTKLLLKRIKAIKAQKDNDTSAEPPKVEEDEDELGAIFNSIKTEKKKKAAEAAEIAAKKAQRKQKRRFTSDGLPIYTEAELKMDNPNAGKTPLCPFDCDCCF